MPSESQAQQHFAAMSKTKEGRAILRRSGKKPMPAKVADEYASTKTKNLPRHVKK